MQSLFIYLSGTIKKSNDTDNPSEWTIAHLKLMQELFSKQGFKVHFLNPAARSNDLSDEFSLFGRDMLQTYLSDFVLADMREKRGIGVGYEIAFANFKNIPIVSWAKLNSHYRPLYCEILGQKLENFTHPFVSQPSKIVVENLDTAVDFIANYHPEPKKPLTRDDYPLTAILHYLATQFQKDKEMYELIENHSSLKGLIAEINKLRQ
jgi:hypothetical protein